MTTTRAHAAAILTLPDETQALVRDALRVRAMDFVADRLDSEAGDEAADVYRELGRYRHWADGVRPFDPDLYHQLES